MDIEIVATSCIVERNSFIDDTIKVELTYVDSDSILEYYTAEDVVEYFGDDIFEYISKNVSDDKIKEYFSYIFEG